MQLRVARLCLDCEEVHGELQCPICASDSFAYLSRWVPVEERRLPRSAAPADEEPGTRLPRRSHWVAGGAISLAAAFAASRWLLRTPASAPPPPRNGANGRNEHDEP